MKLKWLFFVFLGLLVFGISGCLVKGNDPATNAPPQLRTEGGIIYMREEDSESKICHLNLHDGKETFLCKYGSVRIEPNPIYYSPTEIMFAEYATGDIHDLVIYNIVTSEKSTIAMVNDPSHNDKHPSLDRSGSNLVYQSKSPVKVLLYRKETAEITVIGPESGSGYSPVISPDGTKVAFVDGVYGGKLLVYDLTQKSIKTVNLEGKFDNPAWKPEADGTSKTLAVEKIVDGFHYVYTVDNPFDDAPKMQQVTYAQWGKKDDYRHPVWSGNGKILFFCGPMLTSSSHILAAVYYDEVLQKQGQAQWYQVSDGKGKIEEPCWAPDLQVSQITPGP
ncbi:MAG TPA: hypothetical protein VEC37_10350 [Bacillota bacterium]|nr:hypothetical protein [Bacillota bacterium]